MRSRRCRAIIVGMFGFMAALSRPDGVEAQKRIPLPAESALSTLSFSTLSPISLSRNGKWVAFAARDNRRMLTKRKKESEREHLARTGVYLENEASDIWISNTETGETRNVTGGKNSNWDPAWSPDGHYLAFLSDRDGSEQARSWVWDSANDSLRLVSNVNVRSDSLSPGIQWMPDSQRLLIPIIPEQFTVDEYFQRVMSSVGSPATAHDAQNSTVKVYRGRPTMYGDVEAMRSSRVNLDALYLHDLALVDVETGSTTSVSHGKRIAWYSVSPDGLRVAYLVVKRLHPVGFYQRVFDLVSVDLATQEERTLVSDLLIADIFGWSPDSGRITFVVNDPERTGSSIFLVDAGGSLPRKIAEVPHAVGPYVMPVWDSSRERFYLVVDGALWRISATEGQAKEFARIPGRRIVRRVSETGNLLWSPDGGKSTVVTAFDEVGKQDGFYKIDLSTGKISKLLENGQCIDCVYKGSGAGPHLIAASAGLVAYIAQDAQHPPDLWVSDQTLLDPRQLTRLNPQFDRYRMGFARMINWLGQDGKPLQGALLLPSDFQAGKQYPLIVHVYPTTLSRDFDQFGFGVYPGPFNMQLFATRGYAVLLPDIRKEGGEDMTAIANSVLPGINEVVKMGIADPDRIGVMGHSAGGYATLALIVQTKRFKAALEASGFGDYMSLYGQLDSDGVAWFSDEAEELLGSAPWQNPVKYVQNSPVYYLNRVETPLLIVHGEEDGTVASVLGDEIFVGLRRLGKEVEYAKYEDESHVPRDWSFANQVDLCHRILDWFDVHLKGNPPPDPTDD